MRKFVSKIFAYPASVRQEIDKMIDKRVSNSVILKFLENYKDRIGGKLPDAYTLQRYVVYKTTGTNISTAETSKNLTETKKEELDQEKATLVQFREQVDLGSLIDNKKELLESMIVRCSGRLNVLIDRNFSDAKWEQHIRGYISEIREIVSVLAKLSGELREDQTIVLNIVQGEMTKFLASVYQVIKEECPEKLDIIKEKLKIKFKECVEG